MRRELCAGLMTAALAAGAVGAVEASASHRPENIVAAPEMTYLPEDAINLSDTALESTLPSAVASEIDTAASITIRNAPLIVTKSDGTKSNFILNGYASGVRINDSEVLTAGHVGILAGSDSKTASDPYVCTDEYSTQPLNDPENPADDEKAGTGAGIRNQTDDVALLHVPSDPQAPYVDKFGPTPQPGDPLYFANYQPTEDGQKRQPGVSTADGGQDLTKPAIIGGVAYKQDGDHLLVIDDIGKNYGKGAPDVQIRAGASGGPVFNRAGQLIGLSVAAYIQRETANDMKNLYNGAPAYSNNPKEVYQVSIVQLINPGLIYTLRQDMQPCSDNVPLTEQAQN